MIHCFIMDEDMNEGYAKRAPEGMNQIANDQEGHKKLHDHDDDEKEKGKKK